MSRKLSKNQPKTVGQPGAEKSIEELKAQLLRLQADFENFRKRTAEEKIQIIQNAKADALLEILPVLDNFQRSLQHLPKELQNSDWTQGIIYIHKQFENIVSQNGLEKIQTLGAQFNPHLHEAISFEKSSGHKSGEIIEEIESGWKFGEQVLKVAKVRVAK